MPFVEDQIAGWAALCGDGIREWRGVEMALREEDEGGEPRFHDEAVPFLQFLALDQLLADGARRRVSTYQHDDDFGLHFDAATTELPGSEGIYRERRVTELPCGHVNRVEVALDASTGDIAEVRLEISGSEVLLVAGEVYDDGVAEPLRFVRGDESVLVFTDPATVEAVPWVPQRRLAPPRRFVDPSA